MQSRKKERRRKNERRKRKRGRTTDADVPNNTGCSRRINPFLDSSHFGLSEEREHLIRESRVRQEISDRGVARSTDFQNFIRPGSTNSFCESKTPGRLPTSRSSPLAAICWISYPLQSFLEKSVSGVRAYILHAYVTSCHGSTVIGPFMSKQQVRIGVKHRTEPLVNI